MPALIDTNISLSRWPFRRLPGDETSDLVRLLRKQGVTEAWAGSFDGLFHRDIAGVNARLAAECRTSGKGVLVPFGSVNPMLPGWEEDLRRCHSEHHMPGIRLHPNYHGYDLQHPEFARLLDLAGENKLIVQIALSMEDERTHHPLMPVPHVDPAPLKDLLLARPALKVQLINVFRSLSLAQLEMFSGLPDLFVDIAMLEGVGGIEELLEKIPVNRILFGSHFPFFHFQSALLKLDESDLGWFQREAITSQNAITLKK
ncbi:MAG: metal-dependent hydrolase [Planctomyces sp.]|nr:metal-dependent hydrolase [Planctomyces sp.]